MYPDYCLLPPPIVAIHPVEIFDALVLPVFLFFPQPYSWIVIWFHFPGVIKEYRWGGCFVCTIFQPFHQIQKFCIFRGVSAVSTKHACRSTELGHLYISPYPNYPLLPPPA